MIVLIGVIVYVGDVYVGDVYELEKGIRPKCAGIMWWNDIYVCLGRYIVSCWIMWQSRELALFIAEAGMRRACK